VQTGAERATAIGRPASSVHLMDVAMPDLVREARSRSLKCLSTGYLQGGCTCQATVPASVARRAWAFCLRRSPARDAGFFQFQWQGEVWLAYGLRCGEVRGVYCPSHRAQRAECRAAMQVSREDWLEAA
jgi:hypothetical protein